MMVAKYQGHIETSILPKKDDVETKVAKAQAEVVDVLPYALRTQAGVRDNVLNIKATNPIDKVIVLWQNYLLNEEFIAIDAQDIKLTIPFL